MTRAFSLLAFGGGFLAISPNLRQTLADGFEKGARSLDQNGPWSYVGVGVVIVVSLLVFMSRASAPR